MGKREIKLSCNSKTRFGEYQKNTFGTLPGPIINGGTCPGATTGSGGCCSLKCKDGKRSICYVENIMNIYKGVKNVLTDNTTFINSASVDELTEAFTNTFDTFRKNNTPDKRYFRLYWSGDFNRMEIVEALTKVMPEFQDIQFWFYTRSFWVVPSFVDLKNVSIYISADPENICVADAVYKKYKNNNNVGISWMGNEIPNGFKYHWVKCPAVTKKLPNNGNCADCKLCMTHSEKIKLRNIQFPLH